MTRVGRTRSRRSKRIQPRRGAVAKQPFESIRVDVRRTRERVHRHRLLQEVRDAELAQRDDRGMVEHAEHRFEDLDGRGAMDRCSPASPRGTGS